MKNLPVYPKENPIVQNMELRDYFAVQAMLAILSKDPDYHIRWEFFDVANFSYQCADAMLEARK